MFFPCWDSLYAFAFLDVAVAVAVDEYAIHILNAR
jgi:hypothetical protein